MRFSAIVHRSYPVSAPTPSTDPVPVKDAAGAVIGQAVIRRDAQDPTQLVADIELPEGLPVEVGPITVGWDVSLR